MAIFRPKGQILILSAIVGGLLIIFCKISLDGILEQRLENALTSLIGAPVEIDDFKFYFRGPAASFDQLRIVDSSTPSRNLIEINKVGFFIEPMPLLAKKLLVNQINVVDVRFGTQRQRKSKILRRNPNKSIRVKGAERSLMSQIKPKSNLHWAFLNEGSADSSFATTRRNYLERLRLWRSQIDSTFGKWLSTLNGYAQNEPLKEIREEFRTHMSGHSDDNRSSELDSKAISELRQAIEALHRELKRKDKELKAAFANYEQLIEQADTKLEQEFKNLSDQAQRDTTNLASVWKVLFGKSVAELIIPTLERIDAWRKVTADISQVDKIESPPAGKGQDIRFSKDGAFPDLQINRVFIGQKTNGVDSMQISKLKGSILRLSTQPGKESLPMYFEVEAVYPSPKTYSISGTISRAHEVPREELHLLSTGRQLVSLNFPNLHYLPSRMLVEHGNFGGGLNLIGDRLTVTIGISASQLSFSFENENRDNALASDIKQAFESIKRLQLVVAAEGNIDDISLDIQVTISQALSPRLGELLNQAIASAGVERVARLKTELISKKQETLSIIESYQSKLILKVKEYEADLLDKLAFLE